MTPKWVTLAPVGIGVGLPELETGRIIELVPKRQTSLRLNDETLDVLQRLMDRLNKKRPEVVELAITHLSGTLHAGQPVFIDPPPEDPKSHKKARNAA